MKMEGNINLVWAWLILGDMLEHLISNNTILRKTETKNKMAADRTAAFYANASVGYRNRGCEMDYSKVHESIQLGFYFIPLPPQHHTICILIFSFFFGGF
jgi:hypothetical protein